MNLLQLGNISLDGSKIHADASKSKAVSYKRLLELDARLRQEVEELFALAEQGEAVAGFGPRAEIARRQEQLVGLGAQRTIRDHTEEIGAAI
jgi:hypothetical protein